MRADTTCSYGNVAAQEIWQTFQNMAMLHGLEITSHPYVPEPEDEGLCSEDKDYEGGFIMVQLAKTYASLIAASCQHRRTSLD